MGLLLSYCFWFFFYRSVRVLRDYQTISCALISAAGSNVLFAKVFEIPDITLAPHRARLYSDACLRRLAQPLLSLRHPRGVEARGDSTWESDLGDWALLDIFGIVNTEP